MVSFFATNVTQSPLMVRPPLGILYYVYIFGAYFCPERIPISEMIRIAIGLSLVNTIVIFRLHVCLIYRSVISAFKLRVCSHHFLGRLQNYASTVRTIRDITKQGGSLPV